MSAAAPTVHPERRPLPFTTEEGTPAHRFLEGKVELRPSWASLRDGDKSGLGAVMRYDRGAVPAFGVIDLGSNTARLVIYRSAPVGPPWSIFEAKDDPRLMSDALPDGRLGEMGRQRGVACLARFRKIMDLHGVRTVRAVATSAVRDAPNRAAFAAEVQRRCGIRLRVLSAAEEARYAYLGVASSLPLRSELIMDLGGGSLQVMSVRRGVLKESLSLPLGALRLHRKFLEHDPPKHKELEALEEHVDKALKAVDALEPSTDERLIGVGGTTRSMAHVMQALRGYPLPRVHGEELRTRDLERLFEILAESSVSVRKEMQGLSADRADIAVAGLAVVLGLLHRRKLEGIVVSGCGIREGIAQEALGRPLPGSPEEMARGSALATVWGFRLDAAHARRVRENALAVYDLTRRQHEGGAEERLSLEVAALLHDLGSVVSFAGHAAHTAYLLRSRPLYGLSHRGILLASLAAGMHEGEDLPGGTLKRWPSIMKEDDDDVARVLGAILALSEALGDVAPRPRFARRGDRLTVTLPARTPSNPRLFERASRWLARSLDLEVEARAT